MNEREIVELAKADLADGNQPKVRKLSQSPIFKLNMLTVQLIKIALGLSAFLAVLNAVLSILSKELLPIGAFLGATGGAVTAYAGKEIAKGIVEAKNG